MGFCIIFDANILDIILNLHNYSFFPFHKFSTNLKYVSTFSNYPNYIVSNSLRNISLRISELFANADICNDKAEFLILHYLERAIKKDLPILTLQISIVPILVKTWTRTVTIMSLTRWHQIDEFFSFQHKKDTRFSFLCASNKYNFMFLKDCHHNNKLYYSRIIWLVPFSASCDRLKKIPSTIPL